MKLKRITISGMHKVLQQTYDIQDGVTYFVGPNGIGKSTILEAIQLALLGYIPGYGKTNEGVMKHSSGPVLTVSAELDNGNIISRTWIRTGNSVSCKEVMTVDGIDQKVENIVGDIELPIFNFNEFRSMTANKLKEWFISFLPNEEGKLNLVDLLKKEAIAKGLPYDEPLSNAKGFISNQQSAGIKGVDLIKAANQYFKDEQSYVKGQISKLQGTVESLIRYDDAIDADEVVLNNDLVAKKILAESVVAYEANKQMQDRLKANIDAAKKMLPAESFDKDERVTEMQERISAAQKEIEVLQADSADINSAISELMQQRAAVPSANAICPYTKQKCETAEKLASDSASKIAEIDKQINFKKEEAAECSPAKIAALASEIQSLRNQVAQIKSTYDSVVTMYAQLIDIGNPPTPQSLADIKSEIATIEETLVKVAANKQYDKLTSTVTQDKFKLENELELLKAWAKLTDANGLQSSLMNKPFEDLEGDMSNYLTAMFGKDTEAKFNLVSKANSFSFGLIREGKYIEFDYLSSGERCLFTLALIMCILNRSQSQIRTIIIDDILDHLDTDNTNQLFDALKKVTDIQFILAGVKECPDKSICVEVK